MILLLAHLYDYSAGGGSQYMLTCSSARIEFVVPFFPVCRSCVCFFAYIVARARARNTSDIHLRFDNRIQLQAQLYKFYSCDVITFRGPHYSCLATRDHSQLLKNECARVNFITITSVPFDAMQCSHIYCYCLYSYEYSLYQLDSPPSSSGLMAVGGWGEK